MIFCCIGVYPVNLVEPIRDLEDIDKLKEALKKHNMRDYFLFVLGINTGMRISELLKLKVGDLFCDGAVVSSIHINQVEYPINKVIKDCFILYQNSIPKNEEIVDAYLFQSRKGSEPIDRSHAYRILNDVAHELKLPYKIGTHTLRKTFGYHHYRQNRDIKYLQRLFNQSSSKQTLKFIGVWEKDDKVEKVMELNL
jgi:integrase